MPPPRAAGVKVFFRRTRRQKNDSGGFFRRGRKNRGKPQVSPWPTFPDWRLGGAVMLQSILCKKPAPCGRWFQAVEKVRWTFSTAFTMPRFSARAAGRKAAAARRKRLLTQAFCRHSIQHEGAPAPSYSPCKKGLFSFRQGFSTS